MSARSPRRVALLGWVACAAPLCAQTLREPGLPPGVEPDLPTRVQELEDEVSRLQLLLGEEEEAVTEKHPVLSSLEVDLYGYVKLDAAYDSACTSTGDFARWVESEETNEDDDQFNMTARQTRLGLRIRGPREGSMQTSGRVEVDFYGGNSENKPEVMLRHAYLELEWPESRWKLLAGQFSDVISPLCVPTVNYSVAWWQGNIGYRRPQIRLVKGLDVSRVTELEFQLAASRTITNRATEFTPKEGDTGSDAGFPTLQARVGLDFTAESGRRTEIGLSGHYGEEEQDLDETGSDEDASSWSLSLDARVPLSDRLSLQGELFTGENLDAYLGGIGQGFNESTGREIEAWGAWIAATVKASELWKVNFGFAMDDPEDEDLSTGARTENRLYFANGWRSLGEYTTLALELAYLDTDYLDLAAGDSLRAQFALIYRF
jgi:hypothetical protein